MAEPGDVGDAGGEALSVPVFSVRRVGAFSIFLEEQDGAVPMYLVLESADNSRIEAPLTRRAILTLRRGFNDWYEADTARRTPAATQAPPDESAAESTCELPRITR